MLWGGEGEGRQPQLQGGLAVPKSRGIIEEGRRRQVRRNHRGGGWGEIRRRERRSSLGFHTAFGHITLWLSVDSQPAPSLPPYLVIHPWLPATVYLEAIDKCQHLEAMKRPNWPPKTNKHKKKSWFRQPDGLIVEREIKFPFRTFIIYIIKSFSPSSQGAKLITMALLPCGTIFA